MRWEQKVALIRWCRFRPIFAEYFAQWCRSGPVVSVWSGGVGLVRGMKRGIS
jgi:hypothetical protein